ncbi:MAG: hypothetical protein C0403_10360 [Desulfobacterium sp.]|nr:hypothetical protein [Desulfobacterium sp.]
MKRMISLTSLTIVLICAFSFAAHSSNQGTWEKMESVPTTASLYSIWGNSPENMFAVGASGTILHYNGAAWSKMTSGTTYTLKGVWGSSGNDVYAVGANATVLHYDGSVWSKIKIGTTYHLQSVWGSSANDVFIVGNYGFDNKIYHYNGTAWSMISGGYAGTLGRIWGFSETDVFVVGTSGRIYRYDGVSWTQMAKKTSYNIADIWGSSGNDLYAVGDSSTILHYNGINWIVQQTMKPGSLYGIGGSSRSNIFALGSSGQILFNDGSQWTSMPSGTTSSLQDILVFSSTSAYVVGNSGTILKYSYIQPNSSPVVEITSPSDTSSFSIDDGPVMFSATAIDPEDGDLSQAIQWSSSINGSIIPPAILSPGTHTITATVTDSGGMSASDTITISILEHVNAPPSVQIISPIDDGIYSLVNGSIQLAANALDPEDGDISPQVEWRSDVDGILFSPAILSVGEHTITAQVYDSQGLSAIDSIIITVFQKPIVVVDSSGSFGFSTIQSAIDAATTVDGDTLIIKNGTYHENITISKRIAIESLNGNQSVFVVASDPNQHVFDVETDHVTIKGLSIYGASGEYDAAVYLGSNSYECNVSENRCGIDSERNNFFGIYLQSTGSHVIEGNTCANNYSSGIKIIYSSSNQITGNICTNNAIGIVLENNSIENSVTNNQCTGGNTGISLWNSSSNGIAHNTCSQMSSGIVCHNSSMITISDNSCIQTGYGISLYMASSFAVTGNNSSSNNQYGLYISNVSEATVTNNIFSQNQYGISLVGSTNNSFRGNTISNNRYGMMGAGSNEIYLNDFINNLYCHYINDDSSHNRCSPFEMQYMYNSTNYVSYLGNYYSGHDLTDSDGNGVTDNPYRVASSYGPHLIVDQYPLASPINCYSDIIAP